MKCPWVFILTLFATFSSRFSYPHPVGGDRLRTIYIQKLLSVAMNNVFDRQNDDRRTQTRVYFGSKTLLLAIESAVFFIKRV